MRKTGLIDRDLFRVFQELVDSLIAFVPDEFADFVSFIEFGTDQGNPHIYYHISSPQHPNKCFTHVDDQVHRAANNLVAYFTRNGNAYPGFRIALQKQPGGTWKNDIQRLDAQSAAERFPSPIPRPLDR